MGDFKYKLIDLGLPSGTLWMDRNIGASSPEDAGLYFAWGETQGYTADEVGIAKNFDFYVYKHSNCGYRKMNKYCNNPSYGNNGYTDTLTTLEAIDDVASQNVSECHIPTKEQIIELMKETDVYCIKEDGTEISGTWNDTNENIRQFKDIIWDSKIDDDEPLRGVEFRKKTDNSIKIFVPYGGYGEHGFIKNIGLQCRLWSSSLFKDISNCAWRLVSNCGVCCCNIEERKYGYNIRGVKNKTFTKF